MNFVNLVRKWWYRCHYTHLFFLVIWYPWYYQVRPATEKNAIQTSGIAITHHLHAEKSFAKRRTFTPLHSFSSFSVTFLSMPPLTLLLISSPVTFSGSCVIFSMLFSPVWLVRSISSNCCSVSFSKVSSSPPGTGSPTKYCWLRLKINLNYFVL